MSQYFVQRGEKIHGPFSSKQLKSGLESGKLKETDLMSDSKAGPWRNVVEEFQEPAPAAEVIADGLPEGEGSLFESVEIPDAAPTFKPAYAGDEEDAWSASSALAKAEKELEQQLTEQREAETWDVSTIAKQFTAIAIASFVVAKENGIQAGLKHGCEATRHPDNKNVFITCCALLATTVVLSIFMLTIYGLGSRGMPASKSGIVYEGYPARVADRIAKAKVKDLHDEQRQKSRQQEEDRFQRSRGLISEEEHQRNVAENTRKSERLRQQYNESLPKTEFERLSEQSRRMEANTRYFATLLGDAADPASILEGPRRVLITRKQYNWATEMIRTGNRTELFIKGWESVEMVLPQ